jgi:hypothetical protein
MGILVVLEVGYRTKGLVQQAIRGRDTASAAALDPAHPYASQAWYPQFLRERAGLRFRWEPFVYSRPRPQRGRYISIDSAGLRVVPRFRVPSGKPVRVFFFGGSTTWGWYDRDSSTRPARVAARLAEAGFDAQVVNFAQTGYVSAQELLALVRELQRGNIPDAVVLWDGVNDIMSSRNNGRVAVSMREFQQDSDAAFNAQRRTLGSVGDAEALRTLMRHSALLRRALELTERRLPAWPVPDSVPFCRDVMGTWIGEARVVDALARAYGFTVLMIWQPQWATSGRPRSAYERLAATREASLAPGMDELEPHAHECARLADSLVAARAAESILNWASLHSGDTGTVYLDQYSHTTERATAIEADTLARLLVARLRPGRPASGPAPTH